LSTEDLIHQVVSNVSVSTIRDVLIKGVHLYYPAQLNARLPEAVKRFDLALKVEPIQPLIDFIRAAGMVEPTYARSLHEYYHLRITHDEEAGYTLSVEYQHMAGTQIIGKLDEKALGALSMAVNNAVLLRDAASAATRC
jgi:hypothetical protein